MGKRSHSCMVFTPQCRCCTIIEAASCLLVSRKEDMAGGIVAAICAIRSSAMTPGPLGIAETRPRAEAPYLMASCASEMLLMQQILTRGFFVACMRYLCYPRKVLSLQSIYFV